MQTVTVVGAGFSGLTTAYFLTKRGFKVHILEKTDRAGGLIKTIRTSHGLLETAANGLLNSARVEALCADIGVPLIQTRREGRKRFIFRGKPKQIPLSLSDIVRMALRFGVSAANLGPRSLETVADWGRRVIGQGATDYLLAPALSGIYAGDPEQLSAKLVFGRAELPRHLATHRAQKGRVRGTVAPRNGMQELIDGLRNYLESAGVEFHFNHDGQPSAAEPTIVCLSASAAGQFISAIDPQLSKALAAIEMLSLATVTCFYPDSAAYLRGFGCLFPRDQGFRARGVLFNDWIFEGRGPAHAETWIFGGALDPDVLQLTDAEFQEVIAEERKRFYGERDEPLETHVTRWPNALPHYSVELERILKYLPPPPANVALVGNYLGRIGLAKILERAAFVAETLAP
jgi:oxygen-dependent protoporphyrinogen oxidase